MHLPSGENVIRMARQTRVVDDADSEPVGEPASDSLSGLVLSRDPHLECLQPTPDEVGLRRIEDAARGDLAWMVTEEIADSVSARASIKAPRRTALTVTVIVGESEFEFEFTDNQSDT